MRLGSTPDVGSDSDDVSFNQFANLFKVILGTFLILGVLWCQICATIFIIMLGFHFSNESIILRSILVSALLITTLIVMPFVGILLGPLRLFYGYDIGSISKWAWLVSIGFWGCVIVGSGLSMANVVAKNIGLESIFHPTVGPSK